MIGMLLGALGVVRNAISAALSAFVKYPWQIGLAIALALSAWLWIGWNHAASDRDAALAEIVTQRAQFVAASEEAERLAIAQKAAVEQSYRDKAHATDEHAQTALADARARADAYARSVRGQVACRSPGNPASPANGSSPESPDRSGEDASMVALTRDDFDTLIENTIRLDEAHKWALTLNQVSPDPAFGQ